MEEMKHKHRSDKDKKDLLTRLHKAEGQIRGIEKMVENDAYCPDILVQVSAVSSALNSFNKELLDMHMKNCVVKDIQEGKEEEAIAELMPVLHKLMK